MDPIPRAGIPVLSNFEVYGPILIGTFIGIFGCGAVLLATLMYLDRYRQSPWFSKALLIVITLLHIAQSAVDCSRVLKILIYHPSLVYFLDIQSRPEELISPVLSIIICTIVQLFLVDRCLLFTRINQPPIERDSARSKVVVWTIGVVLCLGVAVSFAGGLGVAIALHNLDSFLQAFRGFNPEGTFPTLATVWLSGSAATDILISGIIIYQLWNAIHDKKKLMKSRMLSAMMTVIVHGGVLVTVLQVAILVTYFESNTAWADFPSIFISKVYSLTLLATWILPRQTHSIPPSRQKTLRKAHWSAPLGFDMPQAIDPDQGRYDRPQLDTTYTETEMSRKVPETTTAETSEIRSPRTFGEALDTEAGTRDSEDLKYAGNMEKWRQSETQYDEDGKRIPGVLDLV